MFSKRTMDCLPVVWWEYKDESEEGYGAISSSDFLSEMQKRVSCKCETIQNSNRK